MTEDGRSTTLNGHEIANTREELSFGELNSMLEEYSLGGATAPDRVMALKHADNPSIAMFITDLNRRLQGSEETLVHNSEVKVGDNNTTKPEDRLDIFTTAIEKIRNADEHINPARIGDTLALTTLLLHPFKDGNGRTSRVLGYIYRDDFDSPDAQEDFNKLSEPRDKTREKGGFLINGYIPYMEEGSDQSNSDDVNEYVERLLTSDEEKLYTGPFGQAELGK